ncbi:MAG: potassium/proton antiporter [Acidobacteriota bacterium]|nr:potassium/proton antiporter [Acidobacteriota bacterium]
MILTFDNALLIASILIFISLIAGKTSYRFGVPVLLFFLAIGMLAGSEGILGIYFDNHAVAQAIGIIALNFILFSGGFETDWKSIKPIVWHGVSLSTLGVLLTAVFVGLFIHLITDFTIYEGLLLGSIVSSTDSAAVFSILRSKGLALKGNLRPTLELESGSNDPMAYVLTITFTELVANPAASLGGMALIFVRQILIGIAFGAAIGYLGTKLFNRIRLDYEGMYPVLMIAIMLFSFAATQFFGGNGFMAVYLAAVILGNQDLIHKRQLVRWFDGIAWFMQITLFITLGLLVFPSKLVPIIGIGLGMSVFMMLIARPLSVFISLVFFKGRRRGKWFISWVGLRGAVPIVFATYPLLAGVEKAHMIFNIVFFVSVTSVVIQGTTVSLVAKKLRLLLPVKVRRPTHTDFELADTVKSELVEIVMPKNSDAVGRQIVDLGFPKTALISILKRDGKFLSPNGATVLREGDVLLVISETKNALKKVYEVLDIHPETDSGS